MPHDQIELTLSKAYEFLQKHPVTDVDGNAVTKKNSKTARAPRENEIVFTSLTPHKGTYYVPKDSIMKFCELVYSDIQNRREFYFTESIPRDNNPFRLDIDMKTIFNAKNSEYKKRRKADIKKIVIRIYNYMCDFLVQKFYVNKKSLVCYVMAKRDLREDITNENGVRYIDGIHLLFPYIRQSSMCLRKITEMIKYIASEDDDVFQGTLSSQSCIDNIETKNWTIYGSSKEGLSYICTYTLYKTKEDSTKIDGVAISETADTIRRFMMTANEVEPIKPRKEFEEMLQEELRNFEEMKKERMSRMTSTEFSEKELSKACDLLHMINSARFEDYEFWRNIGFALNTVSHGHEKGFELWREISEKMDPNGFHKTKTQQTMIDIWEYASKRQLQGDGNVCSMGTIVHFAKEDSPELYDQWNRNIYNSDIDMAITKLSEGRICTLAFHLYGREFVYTKEDNWYNFNKKNGHWRLDKFRQPKHLFNLLNVDLKKYLLDYITTTKRTDLFKYGDKIEDKFEKEAFINGIIKFAQKKFSEDEDFEQKLDQNKWLIGTQNGVYDLKNCIHRVGLPEDYVSLKMGSSYRNFTWDHPEVKAVMRYWAKLHVDPKLREWFLKAIAVCMVAGNIEKMIIIMTNNDGNAGKSKALELIEMVFGEYAETMKRERFVTNSFKSASGTDQDLANMKNKRLGTVKELSKDETIDVGALKAPSDSMQYRGIYEKGGTFKPLFTMLIMLNKLPTLSSNDKPTYNRFRIIPHESIFDENAPNDPITQWKTRHFKPDKNIDQKLQKLKDAAFWVFIEYYKKYTKDGLDPIPAKVLQATREYRQSNDIFEQFINSKLVLDVKDKNTTVKIDDNLYKEYTNFHQLATKGSNLKVCKLGDFKTDVLEYFTNKKLEIGKTPKGLPKYFQFVDALKRNIRGYRYKTEEEEELEMQEEDIEKSTESIDFDIDVQPESLDDMEDYKKYFIGSTFEGLDDDENSVIFSNK